MKIYTLSILKKKNYMKIYTLNIFKKNYVKIYTLSTLAMTPV